MGEVLRYTSESSGHLWPLSAAEALPRENVCTVEPEGAGTTLAVSTEEGALRPSRLHARIPAWPLRDATRWCPAALLLCALLF